MDEGSSVRWCRSCGTAGINQSARACPECGVELADPIAGPNRVGLLVKIGGGLAGVMSRPGICLSNAGGSVEILSKGEEISSMAEADFDALPPFGAELPPCQSAAGRLMAAYQAVETRQLKAKWNNANLAAAGVSLADADVASRRGAVGDWLTLGLDDHVDALDLSATEVTWSRALTQARAGNATATLVELQKLSHPRYPAMFELLLPFVDQLIGEPELGERARALAAPYAPECAAARALCALFDGVGVSERIDASIGVLDSSAEIDGGTEEELRRLLHGIAEGTAEAPKDPDTYRAVQAHAVYHHGMGGASVDADSAWLITATLPIYDDLIDRGSLTAAGLDHIRLMNDPLTYVKGRLDPADLTMDQLERLDHNGEIARRCYLKRDAPRLRQLPTDDVDVAHYSALLEVHQSGTGVDDRLRPPARDLLAEVEGYRERIRGGTDESPSDAILADPSCWRMLVKEALAGRLRAPAALRDRWPQFADWVDLCEIQSCVFARDWDEVRRLSARLLARADDERVRDEIESMAAYAEYQLGNTETAMRYLTSALEGRHTEALIVNASIVASSIGSEYAAKFLARVYDEASDPDIGLSALMKGVSLWFNDDDSKEPPSALVSSIRNALTRPMTDELLRLFTRFEANHDTDWLASAPPVNHVTEGQQDLVSFYTVLARSWTAGYPETMRDVALTLARVLRSAPAINWATNELSNLVENLMEAVHVPFGEAFHLAPPIDVLLQSHLLTLAQELVLGPQAGTHLAAHLAEDGKYLNAEVEQRLLWEPAAKYLQEKNNIPEGARDFVGTEISRCLTVATKCMMDCAESYEENNFKRSWNTLVAREQWDLQNRLTILRQERALLDEFARLVGRCSRYEQEARRLPLNADQKKLINLCRDQIDHWTNELARLRSMV
jgi:hypothetical protein